MIDALSIASSGLSANQAWIDSISNNVANMQTIGFKRSQVGFQDLVQKTAVRDGASTADADQTVGVGTQTLAPTQMFTQGAINETGNTLDLAIQGDGFFEITLPSGEVGYTRAGRFHLNSEGQLTLGDGQILASDVRIPPDAINVVIQQDGQVQVKVANTGEILPVGQIHLARFASSENLRKASDGTYRPTDLSGEAVAGEAGSDGRGILLQAHVELSNVDLTTEMTNLVMAQRSYQLNARLLQASDQIMETINNLRR